MELFLQEISEDINWRMGELATVKTIPFRYSLISEHQNFLLKYLVPSCYAIWEGFVKNSFDIYTRQLNSLAKRMEDFSISIVSHSLERKYPQIKNEMNDQRKIEEFLNNLFDFTNNNFSISPNIPTKSNINLKVVNDILRRYNLDLLPDNPFKDQLNKLLRFRNSIAHGDNSLPVSKDNVFEFTSTINNLMYEVYIRIEDGYIQESFLR